MFRLASVGMSYPGLHTSVKSYMWKVIGSPTLVYGMETIFFPNHVLKMRSTESTIIKNVMGIRKRSHQTQLLRALDITSVDSIITKNAANLFQIVSS